MSQLVWLILPIIVIGVLTMPVFGQTDVEIPPWVKGVANFWVEDKINDGEFAEALEFLIDSNIIQLGDTKIMSDPVVEENPFGIEEDLTLQKKYDDAVAYYQKKTTDQKEEYEKEINDLRNEMATEQAEQIENHRISEEEKDKLKTEINDLKFKLAEK